MKYPVETLTQNEVTALIRACSNRTASGIRNRALVVALYRGGLRFGEALALRPKDIDTDAGALVAQNRDGVAVYLTDDERVIVHDADKREYWVADDPAEDLRHVLDDDDYTAAGAPAGPKAATCSRRGAAMSRRTKVARRGGIYFRLDRKGRRVYELDYRDSDGRRRWKTVRDADGVPLGLEDAERARDELRGRLRRGERVAPRRVTLRQLDKLGVTGSSPVPPT